MEQQLKIDLAVKYFLGTLSKEERTVLEDYLDRCSDAERASFFWLVDEQRTLDDLKDLYEVSPVPVVDGSLSTRSGEVRRLTRSWRWVVSTAAMLLLMLGGVALWRWHSTERRPRGAAPVALAARIAPGGNKARLILSNGQTVTLDSLSLGTVTRQDNTEVVKLSDGQIAYHFDHLKDNNPYTNSGYNTLETPVGGQYQVVLPDRTKVWLDASSSIRFPTTFNGMPERRVVIKGEAYLEVARDAEHPFIVSAGGAEVRVLGTHFNVMAYPEEPAMKTTLYEGQVKVTAGREAVVIRPGQQALLKEKALSIDTHPDLESAIAWKEGNFVFAGADIRTVMRSLARWYDIRVEYEGAVSPYTISANVGRNIDISEVLSMLESAGFHFKIKEGKTVVVYQ